MARSLKDPTNKEMSLVVVILMLVLMVSSNIMLTAGPIVIAKKSSANLVQMPSEATDFPGDDPNAVEVTVSTAKKDIIGSYHVRGEIKNLGSDTLQFVQVKAHFFDANDQPVGTTSCCYADPSDIEPGHTSTFDSFAQSDELSGKPSSFRLSFDWQYLQFIDAFLFPNESSRFS